MQLHVHVMMFEGLKFGFIIIKNKNRNNQAVAKTSILCMNMFVYNFNGCADSCHLESPLISLANF